MAITNDGLYTWYGGATTPDPGKFIFPAAVTQIYAVSNRSSHTLALTNDGLYAWGGNGSGELGDGTTITRNFTAARVIFPAVVTSVTAIAAGYNHSLAITNDGLYAWGDNENGEVGDGTRTDRLLPVKVVFPPAVTTVTAIAASQSTSYALTNNGAYAWGNDYAGQLGNGSFGYLPDGTSDMGQTLPVKVLFNIGTKGKTATTVTSVTAIAAGEHYALAITNDGLYAWGENLAGCLGNGNTTNSAYPVKVLFNVRTNSKDKTPPAVTSIYAIAAGRITSFAITNDGLYAWGYNGNGELGLGSADTSNYKLIPTKVPGEDAATSVAAGEYFTIDLH
jgi:alpha-tubulin suppressor-like RCC1 family protein